MKNKLTLMAVVMMICSMAVAQAPERFNYQAIARDGAGAILASQNLGVRMTIRSGSAGGSIVYRETHAVTTNQFGLFTLAVGGGTPVTGTVGAIDWSSNTYYAETEIDPAGGTTYTSVGAAQLLSVPYALYAKDGGPWKRSGNNISNTNTGNVGVGTASPTAALHVVDSGTTTLALLKKGGRTNGPTEMLRIETDSISAAQDLISLSIPTTAPANAQFIEFERGGSAVAQISTNGDFDTDGEYQRDQTGTANTVAIAYGTVSSAGSLLSGTSNVTVANVGTGLYDVTIAGESYIYSDYTTVCSLAGIAGFCRASSVGGKLRIATYNSSAVATDAIFTFVTFKN